MRNYNLGGHQKQRKPFLFSQPSSAAEEQAFSLLNNSLGPKQSISLELDHSEAAIMLQYNTISIQFLFHGKIDNIVGHNRAPYPTLEHSIIGQINSIVHISLVPVFAMGVLIG